MEAEISQERFEEMLEGGQWCYKEEDALLINIETGEIMSVLDWLRIRGLECQPQQ